MKRAVLGILAHVDAGKTTLSEGLLYATGAIRNPGRVDHGDSFLDTNAMERNRGITIFSKQAMLETESVSLTLLDTPGHVDFSAEMERTMQVLDYAVLVISGADGVQSHTETLWKLLEHYQIPTFIFINKMDIARESRAEIMSALSKRLSDSCISFSDTDADFHEAVAMQDAMLLDAYLENGQLTDAEIAKGIAMRRIFPVYFGAALRQEGVAEFFEGLCQFIVEKPRGEAFGAKIFKITEDEKGQRLVYMKITGGRLEVKSLLSGQNWQNKVNEIRIYSGEKYIQVPYAEAGSVCTVPGLEKAAAGEGLGSEPLEKPLLSEPVLTYGVLIPEGTDAMHVLSVFRKLSEEETKLHVLWDARLGKINVQVMGEVQLEIIKEIMRERFGLSVSFGEGSILYKETVKTTVEGVGHFEPLRHYAEVHLMIEPLKRGSGVLFASACSEDALAKNWQRLVLTHLAEKTHRGVLAGMPLTDVKITLLSGRAHVKHTEGGDFRQATYRAVRQGLMQAESELLEPWYDFRLELPQSSVGRALTDLEHMGAEMSLPAVDGDVAILCGRAPVSAMREYQTRVLSFTNGRGRLTCNFAGYDTCLNAERVLAEIGYDAESDVENTADSVFCSHGAGVLVKWNEVFDHMHLPTLAQKKEEALSAPIQPKKLLADDETLLAIYERTYGKIKMRTPGTLRTPKPQSTYKARPVPEGPEYLLVDGYNILYAWEEMADIATESVETARHLLLQRIANYKAMREENVIVVFDAYRVPGGMRSIEKVHDVSVIYTKEAETADAYIEKTTKTLSKKYRVRVATSDRLEQIITFGHGTRRVPAKEFISDIESAEAEMRARINEMNKNNNL